MGFEMDGYIEVNERILAFKHQHPEGSLQSKWEIVEVGGQTFVVVVGYAYRTADDERPGMGTAWEPYPGKTPYTKQSELMVGETSAWGRAIAALGFEVKKGVASSFEKKIAQERRVAEEQERQAKRISLADVLSKRFGGDTAAIGEFVKAETGKAKTSELTIEQMDELLKEVAA